MPREPHARRHARQRERRLARLLLEPFAHSRDRWLAGDDGHVADAHELTRAVAIGPRRCRCAGSDLRRLGPLVRLDQVDRLLPDHSGHAAGARRQFDPLADQHLRVPAADPDETQEAAVLDVRDDQADLVDVADDRERAAAAGPGHSRGGTAHHVAADVLGEAARGVAEGRGRGGLVARRAGSGQQRAQDGRDRHDADPTQARAAGGGNEASGGFNPSFSRSGSGLAILCPPHLRPREPATTMSDQQPPPRDHRPARRPGARPDDQRARGADLPDDVVRLRRRRSTPPISSRSRCRATSTRGS